MKTHLRRLALVLIVALLLSTLAVTVTAAQGDVARADTVIFDIDGSDVPNPTNFNPLVPGTNKNQGAHQSMWEPLFILNYETGKIDPWLGESFTPNSTLDVWTLKLRDGVKWSDGVPFTADDVVFTINLLLNDADETFDNAANMQQWVSSVKKIDDLTVEFDLKSPNPRFQLDYFSVRIWGGIVILPQHVWQGQDPATFTNYDTSKGWPIGTGPYKLTSASPTQFVWDEDPNWWGAATGFHALPEPKRLIWEITGSEDNKALLMSSHQLDSVMNITLGAFQAIQAQNPNVVAWESSLPYAWADPCPRELTLNNTVAPWDDPNMRKAVNMIIDRNEIVSVAYEGATTTSSTMFVQYPAMDPFIKAITDAGMGNSPTADVAGGQALITAAGYALDSNGIFAKNGTELSMDIITDNSTAEYTRTVDDLVEQFQKAGINASSHPVTGDTSNTDRATGNFEAAYNWDQCGSINEPWNSLHSASTDYYMPIGTQAPGDYMRWDTDGAKAYSQIVTQIGTLPLGDPQIPGLVAQAYKYVYDETPFISLVQAAKLVPFDTTYWTGWPTADNAYLQPATWWQSTFEILMNLKKAGTSS